MKDLIDNTRGERSQERPPKNEESVLKLFVINVVILSSLSRSCIRYQVKVGVAMSHKSRLRKALLTSSKVGSCSREVVGLFKGGNS